MPLLRVNATASGISMHDTPLAVAACLRAARRRCPGPAVIMVHGYKYAPSLSNRCPHKKIFARDTVHSWPDLLELEERGMLGIAFGWAARGRLADIATQARDRGVELARLVRLLREQDPRRPVQLIAHSLGATLVLSAMQHLRRGDLDRIVLLAGAAHRHEAETALRSRAGASATLINLTSRENDLFDFAFEWLAPGGRALGQGIDAPNALTVQIDCADTLTALATLGHDIAPPLRRVCHWSTYTRPGVMAMNACLLDPSVPLSIDDLRRALPVHPTERWSHMPTLFPRPLAAALKTRIMGRRSSKGPNHEHAY